MDQDSDRKRELLSFFLFSVCYATLLSFLKPWEGFFSDPLLKIHEAVSLVSSGFRSETLTYPGRSLDEDLDFFLWKEKFVYRTRDGVGGVFPVFLSVLYSPFAILKAYFLLPFFGMIFHLGSAWILRRSWNLSWFWIVFAFFGTFVFLMGPEASEHPILLFLSLLGFTGLFREGNAERILGGVAVGLAVWLRLEALPFFGSIWLAGALIHRKDWIRRSFSFSFSFSIISIILLIFNVMDYGHIFGPRFSENFGGVAEDTIGSRVWDILVGSYRMPGYFLYLPISVVLFWKAFRLSKGWDDSLRILLFAVPIFLPLVAFSSPNNGISNWGPRYLGLSLFPLTILLQRVWEQCGWKIVKVKGFANGFASLLLLYSFGITLAGALVYKTSLIQIRETRSVWFGQRAEVLIFSDPVLCNSIGTEYFRKTVFCASNQISEDRIESLLKGISAKFAGKRLGFVGYGDDAYVMVSKKKEEVAASDTKLKKYLNSVLSGREKRDFWIRSFRSRFKDEIVKTKKAWEYREYEIQ
ncbi:hypothetical protein EHO61_10430 [Leptospira fluminis]|uniref:Dolichyl-phosphate-mannose-protein mannosyltransferase n=1 Tax=Leptospira fluminis TaxID=2484979 RepID=A0A4R9GNH3_9LEPT|nr:hypothetical protein [Leptospira fluminis]TGK17878.1 hypothetical protein EHO61_10430 [Leptospira fluminis]